MSPVEVLRAAKALLTEETWTKSAYARDECSRPVQPPATEACRWCALGAIAKVSGQYVDGDGHMFDGAAAKAETYLWLAAGDEGWRSVGRMNDTVSDVSEVLRIFDAAIELAEKEAR